VSVTEDELARRAVDADLASGSYRAGEARGYWQTVRYDFPILVVKVFGARSDAPVAFDFWFELKGFKGAAPVARIWNAETDSTLPAAKRPQAPPRVAGAFKTWQHDTVYRPWERYAMAHGDWARKYPTLIWHSGRDLAFVLEDLHELLASV
jgi:hypothetical protein